MYKDRFTACEDIKNFFNRGMMLMQWTGQKLHGARLAMFACTGIAYQSVPMHGAGVTFYCGEFRV
jgi:hypothetical protein